GRAYGGRRPSVVTFYFVGAVRDRRYCAAMSPSASPSSRRRASIVSWATVATVPCSISTVSRIVPSAPVTVSTNLTRLAVAAEGEPDVLDRRDRERSLPRERIRRRLRDDAPRRPACDERDSDQG